MIFSRITLLILFFTNFSWALLEVRVIKNEDNALPVKILPFQITGSVQGGDLIEKIITNNLNRTGHFSAKVDPSFDKNVINFSQLRSEKFEALVIANLEKKSEKIFNIQLKLIDPYSEKIIMNKKYAVHDSGIRRTAHFLSDQIYESILGIRGSFDTRLAYVTVSKNSQGKKEYRLEISDSDAQNPKTIITSTDPILSPVWSPDQNKIAYVSFRNLRSEVFVQYPFVRRKTLKLPYFDGIASSPSWHPDGNKLAITLSKDGNKDIYLYDMEKKSLERITKNPSIDTEASFSSDGKKMVFTSNRSGQVQIYIMDLESKKISRATYEGNYNAKAVFSPDGKSLALVHRLGKDYRVGILDIQTRDLTILTENELDESPFFAPSGDMIIYSTNKKNRGILSVVSIIGRQTFELSSVNGEVREPSWSNYSQ